jgi:hypothetical protein
MGTARWLVCLAFLVPATFCSAQMRPPSAPIIPFEQTLPPYDPPPTPPGAERWTLRAAPLLWWVTKDNNARPLLTAGGPDPAVRVRPEDVSLLGPYVGGEFGGHYWFDADQRFGLDASFFFLGRRSRTITAEADDAGAPLLSVPFNDVNPAVAGPSFAPVSMPGLITGTVHFEHATRLGGAEVAADLLSSYGPRLDVSALVGFRYLDLSETFSIVQELDNVGGQTLLFQGVLLPAADSLRITDAFRTRNRFFGANFVVRGDYLLGDGFSLGFTAKAAVGTTLRLLNVNGTTQQLTPDGDDTTQVQAAPGGLLAQPNVIGRRTDQVFTAIPEVQVRLNYDPTRWMRLSLGYGLLYWANVLRPGDHIPDTLNTATTPSRPTFGTGGPVPPPPGFRPSNVTAHGLNLGLAVQF